MLGPREAGLVVGSRLAAVGGGLLGSYAQRRNEKKTFPWG